MSNLKLYKTKVKINNQEKIIVCYNHELEETTTKKVDQIHHIHILDRSGSMYSDISKLIENVKETIDLVDKDDLISVLWFSSAGEYRTLLKGSKPSESIKKLLDSINSTLNLTCFSEAIKETSEIVDELSPLCSNVSITLFTDGQPVVPWSSEEEYQRCYDLVDGMKDKVLAFNTIGYGNYYNKEFLTTLPSYTEYGQFIHSSNIKEYSDIFTHNFETINDLTNESVNVLSNEFMDDTEIIYLNDKFAKLEINELSLSKLSKIKNQFFFVVDNEYDENKTSNDEVGNIKINEETVELKDITKTIPKTTLKNFFYAYASKLYYKGKRKEALRVLAEHCNDKFLVDNQIKAFTFDEVANHQKLLDNSIFNNPSRYKEGKCQTNYLPAKDALCVMDVLNMLQSSDNSYYVPYGKLLNNNYQRIGKETKYSSPDLFIPNNEEVYVPFSDFVYNEKELNLSLRFVINGKVNINPKSAKRVGLKEVSFDSKIYKNHTIIKDGSLNLKEIEILTDGDLLQELSLRNDFNLNTFVKQSEITDYNIEGKPLTRMAIDLSSLPIINDLYIDKSNDLNHILYSSILHEELKAKQKVLRYFIDKAESSNAKNSKVGKYKDLTKEQIEVLEEHGLNKDFTYNRVGASVSKNDDSDFYEVKNIEFSLKGLSSLPAIDKALEADKKANKSNKPLLIPNLLVVNAYKNTIVNLNKDFKDLLLENKLDKDISIYEPSKYSIADRKKLDQELSLVKKGLLKIKSDLASIRLSKVLNNDWFEGLELNDKGNYSYSLNNNTLNISSKYSKHYF